MLIPVDIEKTLTSIEGLIHQISEALIKSDAQALSRASENLRQGIVDFSQILPRFGKVARDNPALKRRLKRISISLASRRESLIRQSGVVERSLNTLVPASCSTTYGKVVGPYGAPGKSSGALNFVAT